MPWGCLEPAACAQEDWLPAFKKKKYTLSIEFKVTRVPFGASLIAQLVKNPPAMQEIPIQFLG